MSTREDSPLQLETAEETQDEPIEEEEEVEEDPVEEEEPEQDDTPVQAAAKSKGKAKAQTALPYEPGKSLLPFSRVQKIIKVDKDIPMVAKEATFLISIATEEFIKRLSQAAHHVAQKERRTTVQQKDIATTARKADEFLFLEELLPWISSDPVPKRPKPKTKEKDGRGPTLMDQFVVNDKDVIMDDDGTMVAAETQDDF